jgi:chemotaxis protein CheY-P-specific phosphatase CheC
MVAQECEAVLAEAASEVLETMYFTGVLGPAEEPDADRDGWVCVRLSFSGPHCGSFGVRAPGEAARTLASNFLGVDEEEISEQQMGEVLCELANIICGATLVRLAGDARFSLTHPEIQPEGPAQEARTVVLQLDTGLLEVWFSAETWQ